MVSERFYLNPNSKQIYLMLAASGILTGFTLVFPAAGFLEWISLVPCVSVILSLGEREDIKKREIYKYGLWFFMSYFCIAYHWFFAMYPLDSVGLGKFSSLVVVIAGCLGVSLIQSLSAALLFLFSAALIGTKFVRGRFWLKPIIIAAIWSVLEWSETLFWFGVPWARLPLGQTKFLLMLRPLAFFGPYFLTFVIVAVNGFIACALMYVRRREKCAAAALLLIASNLLLGICSTVAYGKESGDKFKAAVIQGNVLSTDKWGESVDNLLDVYFDLTSSAAKDGAELIVWPETSIPVLYEKAHKRVSQISDFAKQKNVDILVGMFTKAEDGNESNSLVLFKSDGTVSDDVYSKRRLVPFGEFVPMRNLVSIVFPPINSIGMLESDLSAGKDSGLIERKGVMLGPLICFDSIFETECLESIRDGAEIIVLPTNDSWFFDSAATVMHLSQAQMRAIESNRYLLRAASAGISSVIDPQGRSKGKIKALEKGYIVSEVSPLKTRTLYSYVGNSIIYFFISFLSVLSLIPVFRKISEKRKNGRNNARIT